MQEVCCELLLVIYSTASSLEKEKKETKRKKTRLNSEEMPERRKLSFNIVHLMYFVKRQFGKH